jgi:hypothetical protein
MEKKTALEISQTLRLDAAATIDSGTPQGGYDGRMVRLAARNGIKRGLGKKTHLQVITPGGAAITSGVAALGTTNLLGLTNLSTAPVVKTYADFSAQPDVPRSLNFTAAKTGGTAVGDGGWAGANSRYAIIDGLDSLGYRRIEWVPLNDTSSVQSIYCYSYVYSITLPIKVNATGDQVKVGYGSKFGFEHPVQAATDILEFYTKPSAGYVLHSMDAETQIYELTTLPATTDVGEAQTTTAEVLDRTETVLTVADGSVFANGAQRTFCELIDPDTGETEEIVISSRTNNDLTIARGVNGTTARKWKSGIVIAKRPGMSFTYAATTNDRMQISYKTDIL